MADIIHELRSLHTIRQRCNQIFDLCKQDKLEHFSVDMSKIDEVADFVLEVANANYPDGIDTVPFHSRWRQFEVGRVNRAQELEAQWSCDHREMARRRIDLVVISVLLDAGAGNEWKYLEESTGQTWQRSEGLGIASFHMFAAGLFSSNDDAPHQADSEGLKSITLEKITRGFQVDDTNPMVGLEGRFQLIQRLGYAIEQQPDYFLGDDGIYRPGNLVNYFFQHCQPTESDQSAILLSIHQLWHAIMSGFEKVWPETRTKIGDVSMGDVWIHTALPSTPEGSNFVPFHKLSQWLTYSIIESLQRSGISVDDINAMTGLPEYRNGGLLIDRGILIPKHSQVLSDAHAVDSEVIIEWRALTVALLDEIADCIRNKLGKSSQDLPLVVILEAGTWSAGRVAATIRPNRGPPIQIISDGTVF